MIKKHFESCPSCSGELARDREIRTGVVTPEDIAAQTDLWPGVRAKMASPTRDHRLRLNRPAWGIGKPAWIAAGLVVLALSALVPFLIRRSTDRQSHLAQKSLMEQGEIVVQSARVENNPARTYYFQSQKPDRLIVWVQKQKI